jgi:hypothetical protein
MAAASQTAAGPRRRSWRTVALFPCDRVLYSREDPAGADPRDSLPSGTSSSFSMVTYRAVPRFVGVAQTVVKARLTSPTPQTAEGLVVGRAMQLLLVDGLAYRPAHQDRATTPEGWGQQCDKALEIVTEADLMLQVCWARPETFAGAELISQPGAIPVLGAIERRGLPLAISRRCVRRGDEVGDSPSDYSIDERGKPGPFRIVGRQTPPQVEGQLLLVILSGHAREQRSASEALSVETNGLGRVGVKDVVVVPQSLHECRRRRGRGHVARSLGGGEFSTDIRCSTVGRRRWERLSRCSLRTLPCPGGGSR